MRATSITGPAFVFMAVLSAAAVGFCQSKSPATNSPAKAEASAATTSAKVEFVIKGVITNVADAASKGVIFKDYRILQLAGPFPHDGPAAISMRFDRQGRVGVAYNLPSTDMLENGSFSIKCGDLEPGTYLVAFQPASLPGQRVAFLQKGGKNLTIEITRDSMPPTLDVGAVTIPVP